MWQFRSSGEGQIGTEQGTSVVSGEDQIQPQGSQPQPSWWASNANCWHLGVRPSHGLKICGETMSFQTEPKAAKRNVALPVILETFLWRFHVNFSPENFLCLLQFLLSFLDFLGEGWCKLNEDRRQKNMQSYDGTESSEDLKKNKIPSISAFQAKV